MWSKAVNQTINHTRTPRLLTTRVMATLWLAGAAGGFAADTPAATNKPAAVAGDVAVLVDDASLWRHFHLVGPCTFLAATGARIKTGLGEQASGGVFQSRAQGGTALMEWPAAFTPPRVWGLSSTRPA